MEWVYRTFRYFDPRHGALVVLRAETFNAAQLRCEAFLETEGSLNVVFARPIPLREVAAVVFPQRYARQVVADGNEPDDAEADLLEELQRRELHPTFDFGQPEFKNVDPALLRCATRSPLLEKIVFCPGGRDMREFVETELLAKLGLARPPMDAARHNIERAAHAAQVALAAERSWDAQLGNSGESNPAAERLRTVARSVLTCDDAQFRRLLRTSWKIFPGALRLLALHEGQGRASAWTLYSSMFGQDLGTSHLDRLWRRWMGPSSSIKNNDLSLPLANEVSFLPISTSAEMCAEFFLYDQEVVREVLRLAAGAYVWRRSDSLFARASWKDVDSVCADVFGMELTSRVRIAESLALACGAVDKLVFLAFDVENINVLCSFFNAGEPAGTPQDPPQPKPSRAARLRDQLCQFHSRVRANIPVSQWSRLLFALVLAAGSSPMICRDRTESQGCPGRQYCIHIDGSEFGLHSWIKRYLGISAPDQIRLRPSSEAPDAAQNVDALDQDKSAIRNEPSGASITTCFVGGPTLELTVPARAMPDDRGRDNTEKNFIAKLATLPFTWDEGFDFVDSLFEHRKLGATVG